MTRLPLLRPGELDEAQRGVYAAITGGTRSKGLQAYPLTYDDGSLRGPYNAMVVAPSVGYALQEVGSALRFATALAPRVREATILTVAAHEGATFVWDAHERLGRQVGLSAEEIATIRAASEPPSLDSFADSATLAAVATTRTLLAEADLDDDQYRAARAVFGDVGVVELAVLVGYYRLLALELRLFRIEGLDR